VTTRFPPRQQAINLPSERNLQVEPFGHGKVQHNGTDRDANSDTGADFLLHMAHQRRVADGEIDAARWVAAEVDGHALVLTQFAELINRRGCTIQSLAEMYLDSKNVDHSYTVKRTAYERPKYEHTTDNVWELTLRSLRSDTDSMLVVLSLISPDVITKELFEVPEPNKLPTILSFCGDDDRCVHSTLKTRLLKFLDKLLNIRHVLFLQFC
jgi:hypothetical protein